MLYALGVIGFFFFMLASIALHEVGHLVPAKRSGVKVTQYMVGFGPTLWSTHRGGTEYGLKAIPLGGYIRMIGMFPPRRERGEDETHLRTSSSGWMRTMVEDARTADVERVTPEDADRVFYKKPIRNKVLIMLGGPTMNLIIGLVLLSVFLLAYGNVHETTTLGRVNDCIKPLTAVTATKADDTCSPTDQKAPAAISGLTAGDKVVAVDGRPVGTWEDVRNAIRPAAGRQIAMTVERNGTTRILNVTPVANQVRDPATDKVTTVGFVGVVPAADNFPVPAARVPGELASYLGRTVQAVLAVPQRMVGVWQAAFGDGKRDPNGPIGIAGVSRIGGEVAQFQGIGVADKVFGFLSLIAGLNLALFVFNLIPLLPLDGGHVAGALYEGARRQVARLRHRPDPGFADVAKMLPVAYVVAIALIAMSGLLLYADIVNPVKLSG